MKQITIALGADHRGFIMKQYLIDHLKAYDTTAINWVDVGAHDQERSDYPLFAQKAVALIANAQASCAVLLCGTGTGMAMTANRFPGIYAGVAWQEDIARLNKEDDNCNVLALPADYLTNEQAVILIEAWLKAQFKSGRYASRIALIDGLKK